ncbi:MAG: hypothetical protein IT338_17215 [Thermomicrobiales bacterium]|nr:hypothetical protein [Thermomicrobiales bacterium]
MRYSVWNPGQRQFDYYDAAGDDVGAHAPKPTHLRARALGSTVEQAAWPLPAGARFVGTGVHAQGRVAIDRAGALGASDDGGGLGLVKIGLLVAAGVVGAKVLLGGKSR